MNDEVPYWSSDTYWTSALERYQEFRDSGHSTLKFDLHALENNIFNGDSPAYKMVEAMCSVKEHEGGDGYRGAPRLVLALLALLNETQHKPNAQIVLKDCLRQPLTSKARSPMPVLPLTTYERFAEFLEKRITSALHLTEDSVRYAFFYAVMQSTSIEQHELVLELPHPKFPGKEIDTYVAAAKGRPELFFEFKFHRSSKSTSAKPHKAGSLFKDVARLASLLSNNRNCLVIYLTCSEMATYFEKNEAAYSAFWRQPTGSEFIYDEAFLAKTTDTFRKASGEHHAARVHVEFSTALSRGYHLRIFNVQALQSKKSKGPE